MRVMTWKELRTYLRTDGAEFVVRADPVVSADVCTEAALRVGRGLG